MKKSLNLSTDEVPNSLEDHMFYGLELDEEQKNFRDNIWNKEKLIIFCNSKSGTGKTTVATATANLLVEYGLYDGIVYIASPTQEQKLGFLKGGIEEKTEPYFEPFYQALNTIGVNVSTSVNQQSIMNRKNGTGYIECCTHTYLRGCNFKNKVVICDEAQNFYFDEMKKTLTRMHDSCKVIILGHSDQCDLFKNQEKSGFVKYLEHFKNSNDKRAAVCNLNVNHRGWISTYADSLL